MTYRSIVRASGWYDLLLTAPFALPFTATLALSGVVAVHEYFGLPGQLAAFEPVHLLYINLMGSIVTVWALLRILRPMPLLGLFDSFGRFAFSAWFAYYPAMEGTSWVSLLLLGPELLWGAVQLGGYLRLRSAGSAAEIARAATA